MEALKPDQRLGAYRIIRRLGEGGMGCVYEAEHIELRVRRAIKVFSAESGHLDFLRKRFVAEGRILADLKHPRIVRVYDFAIDEETGTPYFAMDLVLSSDGNPMTLQDACDRGLDEAQVFGWFRDICEGLGYIHSHHVVHRDIALDNILIDRDGRAVIGDFGIAKIVGDDYRRKINVTMTMVIPEGERLRMGKGLYMAPEIVTGQSATAASDAYAVGVLMFRLLSGSWYTRNSRLEDALAGLEYSWFEVLASLLDEDPRRRLPQGGFSAVPSPRLAFSTVSFWKRPMVLVAIGAIVLVLAVASLIWHRESREKTARPTSRIGLFEDINKRMKTERNMDKMRELINKNRASNENEPKKEVTPEKP